MSTELVNTGSTLPILLGTSNLDAYMRAARSVIGKVVNAIIEILANQELEYRSIYTDLFFNDKIICFFALH